MCPRNDSSVFVNNQEPLDGIPKLLRLISNQCWLKLRQCFDYKQLLNGKWYGVCLNVMWDNEPTRSANISVSRQTDAAEKTLVIRVGKSIRAFDLITVKISHKQFSLIINHYLPLEIKWIIYDFTTEFVLLYHQRPLNYCMMWYHRGDDEAFFNFNQLTSNKTAIECATSETAGNSCGWKFY